jgi:cell division protein FtsN
MAAKPIARDYKHSRQKPLDLSRWREFAAGLGLGLAVAVGLFAYQRNALQRALAEAETPRPDARRARMADASQAEGAQTPAADAAGVPGEDDTNRQYDFYEMLPRFEVVVPEKEREVKRDLPSAPIERPGVYVLQAGSYRKLEDAQRIQKQLALQSIDAAVQRVAVDADVWHRVRIGPVTDLAELNRLRNRLRGADLDALVIRVGD